MNVLARAMCSSAVLFSGTLLLCTAALTENHDAAGVTGVLGFCLIVVGLYGCLRIAGMKLYSGQPNADDAVERVRSL